MKNRLLEFLLEVYIDTHTWCCLELLSNTAASILYNRNEVFSSWISLCTYMCCIMDPPSFLSSRCLSTTTCRGAPTGVIKSESRTSQLIRIMLQYTNTDSLTVSLVLHFPLFLTLYPYPYKTIFSSLLICLAVNCLRLPSPMGLSSSIEFTIKVMVAKNKLADTAHSRGC